MAQRYLLIITCSRTKNSQAGLLSAWARYQGRVFSTLKDIEREGLLPQNLDIVIISGKYGFLRPDDKIEYYDQPMTEDLAISHAPQIKAEISKMLISQQYCSSFILLEPIYLSVLENIQFPQPHYETEITPQSLESLKEWILQIRN